ncbi:MAG: hypothetical protein MESAZ_03043 [Saezia sanguinis]
MKQSIPMKRSLSLICTALALSVSVPAYAGSPNELERQQLALMLRQLDMTVRIAHESAKAATPEASRYHFDYQRFNADMARVRAGIEDYLTPQRAQPRDPVALAGQYRAEQSEVSP